MSRRRVAATRVPVTRAAAAGGLAVSLVLSGCTGGSGAVDQQANGEFRYVGATASGHLIAPADRKPAGNATAPYLTGGTFELASLKGRVGVLNYWATWCPPCVVETPEFDKISRSLDPADVQFVGIDVKESDRSPVTAFVADNKISYPIVYDEIARTALKLGKLPMAGLPDTVLIDRQGRVAAVYVGIQTAADIEPAIKTLAAETG